MAIYKPVLFCTWHEGQLENFILFYFFQFSPLAGLGGSATLEKPFVRSAPQREVKRTTMASAPPPPTSKVTFV